MKINWYGEHPLRHLLGDVAGEETGDLAVALGHLHAVAFDGGVDVHAFVLEPEPCRDGESGVRSTGVAGGVSFGARQWDWELDVGSDGRRQSRPEGVDAADGGGEGNGRGAAEVVADADFDMEAVGPAKRRMGIPRSI